MAYFLVTTQPASARLCPMEDLLHFLFALLAIFAPLLLVAWLLFRTDRKN